MFSRGNYHKTSPANWLSIQSIYTNECEIKKQKKNPETNCNFVDNFDAKQIQLHIDLQNFNSLSINTLF